MFRIYCLLCDCGVAGVSSVSIRVGRVVFTEQPGKAGRMSVGIAICMVEGVFEYEYIAELFVDSGG
jgi:hypothetical protein